MNDEQLEDLMYRAGLTAQGCWDSMDQYAREAIMDFARLVAAEKDKEIERLESERNAAVKALLCDAERHLIGICDVTNFMSDEVAALLNRIRTACAARGET